MGQELTPSESKVYTYLQGLLKGDDQYVEINDISEVAGILELSESGVYLALKALDSKARIHVFYKNGRGSGKRSIKIYMFNSEKNSSALNDALKHLQTATAILDTMQKASAEQEHQIEELELKLQNNDLKIAELEERLGVFQHLQDYMAGKVT
jgi:hypothetical protein